MTTNARRGREGTNAPGSALLMLGIAATLVLALVETSEAGRPRSCSDTAQIQLAACKHEVQDDSLTQKAKCINVADDAERAACLDENKVTREEAMQACKEQRDARRAICDAIGEERYDPDFDPANFDTDFTNPPHLNSALPAEDRLHVGVRCPRRQ